MSKHIKCHLTKLVRLENDGDTGITVQTRNFSVNSVMIDTMMSADVQPGKKSNDSITMMGSDLENNGITSIEELVFIHQFL